MSAPHFRSIPLILPVEMPSTSYGAALSPLNSIMLMDMPSFSPRRCQVDGLGSMANTMGGLFASHSPPQQPEEMSSKSPVMPEEIALVDEPRHSHRLIPSTLRRACTGKFSLKDGKWYFRAPVYRPDNFRQVISKLVYRSAYPTSASYQFLASLHLRTILVLVGQPTDPAYHAFMNQHGIRLVVLSLGGNKDGDEGMDPAHVRQAHEVLLDRANWPVLVHCNKGKHRTGCVVATLQKVRGNDIETVVGEYKEGAGKKARAGDERFIRAFDAQAGMRRATKLPWNVRALGNVARWVGMRTGVRSEL